MDFLILFLVDGLFQLLVSFFTETSANASSRGQDRAASRASIHTVANPESRSTREWAEIRRPPAPGALDRRSGPTFEIRLGKGTRCLVCGDALESHLYSCPDCATPHHEECWAYNRGCSTYGCRRAHASRRH